MSSFGISFQKLTHDILQQLQDLNCQQLLMKNVFAGEDFLNTDFVLSAQDVSIHVSYSFYTKRFHVGLCNRPDSLCLWFIF